MRDPIYLDYNATTPVARQVADAMIKALREAWGNPSSGHAYGLEARRALDEAREQVAGLLACEPGEVVFTAGGTESDNTAIVGVAEALVDRGRHIVVSCVEHPAVEEACRYLETRGWSVTRVAVDGHGRVRADAVADAVGPETTLVSVMHAQNETGVIQPVRDIVDRVRPTGVIVHTDAAQTVGKIVTRVNDLGVDLLTVAAHKLYGPKGVGALYVREGTPLGGFLRGGGHERGRRAGTENVPAIVGLGAACALASRELPQRSVHLRELRDRLEAGLRRHFPDLVVHGKGVERLPNTVSCAIPGVPATELLAATEGVATAAGSACEAGKPHVSAALSAMGVDDATALSTVRLTVGRPTMTEDVDEAVERIAAAATRLRGVNRKGDRSIFLDRREK
jgi:cysteine desulfurase